MTPQRFLAFALAAWLAGPAIFAVSVRGDTWTDLSGTKTIDAEFVGVWHDSVILRRNDGTRVSVPLAKLNSESRLRADALDKEQSARRQERIAQLQEAATSASAGPAAVEVSGVSSAPAEGSSLPSTVNHVLNELKSGHLEVLWQSLPASYQQDLNQVFSEALKDVDEQLMVRSNSLQQKIGRVLYEKSDFVANHRLMASVPPQAKPFVDKAIAPVGGLIMELSDADPNSINLLRTGGLGSYIEQRGPKIGGRLLALLNTYSDQFDWTTMLTIVTATENGGGAVTTSAIASNELPSDAQQLWEKDIIGQMQSHCAACHSGNARKGMFSFDSFVDLKAAQQDPTVWQTVREQIETGEMPPRGKPPMPDDSKRSFLASWSKFFRSQGGATSGTVNLGMANVEMVKVQNRWVPKAMADGWANTMKDAPAKIREALAASQAELAKQVEEQEAKLAGPLDAMLAASTQAEFDAALKPIEAEIEAMVQQAQMGFAVAAAGGGTLPGAGGPAVGGPAQGPARGPARGPSQGGAGGGAAAAGQGGGGGTATAEEG